MTNPIEVLREAQKTGRRWRWRCPSKRDHRWIGYYDSGEFPEFSVDTLIAPDFEVELEPEKEKKQEAPEMVWVNVHRDGSVAVYEYKETAERAVRYGAKGEIFPYLRALPGDPTPEQYQRVLEWARGVYTAVKDATEADALVIYWGNLITTAPEEVKTK